MLPQIASLHGSEYYRQIFVVKASTSIGILKKEKVYINVKIDNSSTQHNWISGPVFRLPPAGCGVLAASLVQSTVSTPGPGLSCPSTGLQPAPLLLVIQLCV